MEFVHAFNIPVPEWFKGGFGQFFYSRPPVPGSGVYLKQPGRAFLGHRYSRTVPIGVCPDWHPRPSRKGVLRQPVELATRLRDTIRGTCSSSQKEVVFGSQSGRTFASILCTPRHSVLLASAVMKRLFATINTMEPSNFYTGIVAELYEPLKSTNQAWKPYAEFIAQSGEPALELGCGDGEPILDLRRKGFDVDGIDSSEDMLARCAQKASQAAIEVALFPQRMEELDLPRRYRSIFLAGPTFTLLLDDETALRALKRIRRHLADGGSALVPLFIPAPIDPHQIGRVSEVVAEDGAILRCSVVSADRDEDARIQSSVLRYEKHANGASVVEDRTWLLHWYTQSGFRQLAEAAGLIVAAVQDKEGQTISPDADATEFKFILQPAL